MSFDQEEIRSALRRLTTEELKRGMRAFEHPPRNEFAVHEGDTSGCFVFEALGEGRISLALSCAYEGYWVDGFDYDVSCSPKIQKWFYGECIRELAERGEVIEQKQKPEEIEYAR